MEASAVRAPVRVTPVPPATPLLRLRSDEQLLALFRAGNDDAFGALHERYRQRLFAYVRQMLAGASRQDAEDVLQDVFVRAYGALRADERAMNVRAWLYRVAHNRCIDQLRRPVPLPAEVFEVSRKPLHDPVEEAQRRDDLRRLVEDVARLPEQQRSALLMREIDGMSYADLASALDVTVPAVKSLLVRARIGLVEAAEARDADCGEIRQDLLSAYDRGVKASGRARRHMRSCAGCRDYRVALRGVRRSFAALSPIGAGPLALVAKLAGVGGAGAGGGAAAAGGGGMAAAGSGVAAAGTVTACKVAAVVCTAVVAGGAVEVQKLAAQPAHPKRAAPRAARHVSPVPTPVRFTVADRMLPHRPRAIAPVATPARARPMSRPPAPVPARPPAPAAPPTPPAPPKRPVPATTPAPDPQQSPLDDDAAEAVGTRVPDDAGAQPAPTAPGAAPTAEPGAASPQATPAPAPAAEAFAGTAGSAPAAPSAGAANGAG